MSSAWNIERKAVHYLSVKFVSSLSQRFLTSILQRVQNHFWQAESLAWSFLPLLVCTKRMDQTIQSLQNHRLATSYDYNPISPERHFD